MRSHVWTRIIFKAFKNAEYFEDLKVTYGTVSSTDDLDTAPETLYAESWLIS